MDMEEQLQFGFIREFFKILYPDVIDNEITYEEIMDYEPESCLSFLTLRTNDNVGICEGIFSIFFDMDMEKYA